MNIYSTSVFPLSNFLKQIYHLTSRRQIHALKDDVYKNQRLFTRMYTQHTQMCINMYITLIHSFSSASPQVTAEGAVVTVLFYMMEKNKGTIFQFTKHEFQEETAGRFFEKKRKKKVYHKYYIQPVNIFKDKYSSLQCIRESLSNLSEKNRKHFWNMNQKLIIRRHQISFSSWILNHHNV